MPFTILPWVASGEFQMAKTFSIFSDFLIQQVPADFRAMVVQFPQFSYPNENQREWIHS